VEELDAGPPLEGPPAPATQEPADAS